MVYGIDLGTTNSLIGVGDTLFTGLVSSNVDTKQRKQVPRDVINSDVVASYKTDMSMGKEGELSVECSAVVLRELARLAGKRSGGEVRDVVISVPAYFSTSQREAVYTAAGKAGLNVKCLINEPTAAAVFLCQDMKDLIVVYDLGGGTFDVTIVDSRMGNYAVIATDGIVLGGDDLDRHLVNIVVTECRIPIRHRSNTSMSRLKLIMQKAKEEVQKPWRDIYVDLSDFHAEHDFILTEEIYRQAVYDVFHETFVRTQYLISRNIPISDVQKPSMVLVGGSSNCPYLKEMLQSELNVDIIEGSVTPDFTVAYGVSLYADMINKGVAFELVEDVTKRLCIEDCSGKTTTIIESNTTVPCTNKIVVDNSTKSDKLQLRLYQGDSVLARNNTYIGTLEFQYEEEVELGEGVVEVTVNVSVDGIISLSAFEMLYGEEYKQEIKLTMR